MLKFKTTILSLGFAALAASQVFANVDETNVELDTDFATTREEIAVIQVLGESCPQIIGKNKNFDAGYQRILEDLLPGVSDPVNALKAYSEEADFQELVKQARASFAKESAEDNRAVCLDVIDW